MGWMGWVSLRCDRAGSLLHKTTTHHRALATNFQDISTLMIAQHGSEAYSDLCRCINCTLYNRLCKSVWASEPGATALPTEPESLIIFAINLHTHNCMHQAAGTNLKRNHHQSIRSIWSNLIVINSMKWNTFYWLCRRPTHTHIPWPFRSSLQGKGVCVGKPVSHPPIPRQRCNGLHAT